MTNKSIIIKYALKLMKISCIIPARLGSKRFPKKILAKLNGKPLLQWVWEAANQIPYFDSVYIAVDSAETEAVVKSFGGLSIMTSLNCRNGTMRLCEAVSKKQIAADIFVNWQADEPFLDKKMIEDLLNNIDTDEADIWTLKKKITSKKKILSPHCVKVVCDKLNYALYFSRNPIPFSTNPRTLYYQHIGLYAYSSFIVSRLPTLKISALTEAEQLEQLDFLYHRIKIRVHPTQFESLGIDTPEQLEEAEDLLNISYNLIKK